MNPGLTSGQAIPDANPEGEPGRGGASRAVHERVGRALEEARAQTDALFDLVHAPSLYARPIRERHRIVFYLGHLEAFDWNLLCRNGLGLPAFDPQLDRLFAFGIDPLDGTGLPSDVASDWPALATIRRYGQRVRAVLDDALVARAFGGRLSRPEAGDAGAVELAIEHRLMHAETLAYLLHQLSPGEKARGPLPLPSSRDHPPRRWLAVPAGRTRMGLEPSDPRFAWDNEYVAHDVSVPAFAIDSRKVTNGDYLDFVRSGGYTDRSLWSAEGWEWRQSAALAHPWYWAERNGRWFYRAMFGEVPLGASWPVYVSHAEASAYARWRGCALPSEAEFHRAAFGSPGGGDRSFPWGETPPSSRHGAFGFNRWDPAPVGSHPEGDTPEGASDFVGNGWEWTSTPFHPFPGFEPLAVYAGYSSDFFDGMHYVLKGASTRTALSLVRRSFRNWFQPYYPYPYAGFRCVEPRA